MNDARNDTAGTSREDAEALIGRARGGDQEALGRLLGLYRNYLWLLARAQIRGDVRARVDASDVVQETCLDACRCFDAFRGGCEGELVAWLRRVLANNLADQLKRHGAAMRDVGRQRSLEAMLDRSSAALQAALGDLSTPSARASRRESAVILADALAALPDDYRDVVILRHVERLKFDEVAARMGRSSGAVRMLWARALERLRALLGDVAS